MMNNIFVIILILFSAYILGSVPFGLIISKLRSKKDIRKEGSGNIGSTNVARVVGFGWGMLTVLLDVSKAVLPLLILRLFFLDINGFPDVYILCGVGFASVIGHIFPVFLLFRGGKGVAVFIGVMLVLLPVETLIFLGIYVLILAVSRYSSLASMFSVACFPFIIILAIGVDFQSLPFILLSVLLEIVIIIKHLPNIKRLKEGKEHRFSFKKGKTAENSKLKTIAKEPNRIKQRGGVFGRAFLHFMAKYLGMWSLIPFAPFIVFYFIIALGDVRKNLMRYWACIRPGRVKFKYLLYIYRQFFKFSISLIERIIIQKSNINKYLGYKKENLKNVEGIKQELNKGKGLILLCSHIGGYNLYRFLMGYVTDKPVHIFMYSDGDKYSLRDEIGDQPIHFIDPTDSVNFVFKTKEALERNEIMIIMGDRVDKLNRRVEWVNIINNMYIKLPKGIFHIAQSTGASLMSLFIISDRNGYRLIVKGPITMDSESYNDLSKKERVTKALGEYAHYIGEIIKDYPFQWYNFASKIKCGGDEEEQAKA